MKSKKRILLPSPPIDSICRRSESDRQLAQKDEVSNTIAGDDNEDIVRKGFAQITNRQEEEGDKNDKRPPKHRRRRRRRRRKRVKRVRRSLLYDDEEEQEIGGSRPINLNLTLNLNLNRLVEKLGVQDRVNLQSRVGNAGRDYRDFDSDTKKPSGLQIGSRSSGVNSKQWSKRFNQVYGAGSSPWQVLIESRKIKSSSCGGVIINRRYILSSAKCLKEKLGADPDHLGGLRVSGNRCSDDHSRSVEVPIEKLMVRDASKRDGIATNVIERDVAILRTGSGVAMRELAGMRPVCLPKREAWQMGLDNRVAKISGWRGQQRAAPTCNLQIANVRVLPKDSLVCDKLIGGSRGLFCAEGPEHLPCFNGSGNPLTMNSNSTTYLMGLSRECKASSPTVFTKIGPITKWIIQNTQDGECV